MSQSAQDTQQSKQPLQSNAAQSPDSFAQAIEIVKDFVLLEFGKQAVQKQLYYHTVAHVKGVQCRADRIYQAIKPYLEASLERETAPEYFTRMQLLLDLCAIAHDLVQEFSPQIQPHTSRIRESGVNEAATIAKLIDYIKDLNKQLIKQNPNSSACFTDFDLQIITEAIEATICLYDPSDQSIYQPNLYDRDKKLSPVARIIAMADIGTLGMDGIDSYNQEGSLLFLEENPDVIPIILNQKNRYVDADSTLPAGEEQELLESLRQRLLKRARFQINFAKARVARLSRELAGFPSDAIAVLTNEVFRYLNQETLQKIESLTPTADDTTLPELIGFFELEKYAMSTLSSSIIPL